MVVFAACTNVITLFIIYRICIPLFNLNFHNPRSLLLDKDHLCHQFVFIFCRLSWVSTVCKKPLDKIWLKFPGRMYANDPLLVPFDQIRWPLGMSMLLITCSRIWKMKFSTGLGNLVGVSSNLEVIIETQQKTHFGLCLS